MRSLLLAIAAAAAVLLPSPGYADELLFEGPFERVAGLTPADTAAAGSVSAVFSRDSFDLVWLITYAGLSGPPSAIRLMMDGEPGAGGFELLSIMGNLASPIVGGATLAPADAEHLIAGRLQLVVFTAAFPAGEIAFRLVSTGTEAGGRGE